MLIIRPDYSSTTATNTVETEVTVRNDRKLTVYHDNLLTKGVPTIGTPDF
jgi:hypothetical protein